MDSTSPMLVIQANDSVESTRDVDRTADTIGILYGSLPRPPDSQSLVVCLWFLQSLYRHIDSGYILVDDVAIWSFSPCRCVPRALQFWLENFPHILGSGIGDVWFVMLLDLPDFKLRTYMQFVSRECNNEFPILVYSLCKLRRFSFFVAWFVACYDIEQCAVSEDSSRHQNLSRQGENLQFAFETDCLDLYETDCYDFLDFVFRVCDVGIMLRLLRILAPAIDGVFVGFHATKIAAMVQHLSLFVKREVCSFEVLLIIVVERLLLFHSCVEAQMRQMKRRSPRNETLCQFHSYVSAHMRLMEQNSPILDVMEVIFLSRSTKENSLSSKWLNLHVIIGSQSCVSRQGKIWSWRATLICDFTSEFAGKKGFWFTPGMLQHQKSCVCPWFVVTFTGLLFQFIAYGVLLFYISCGDLLIFLKQIMLSLIIVDCGSVNISGDEVFALCATNMMFQHRFLLVRLQEDSQDIEVLKSKMKVPFILRGSIRDYNLYGLLWFILVIAFGLETIVFKLFFYALYN